MTDNTTPGTPLASPADDSARAVFLAWERLRLTYNAALAIVVLSLGGGDLFNGDFVLLLPGAVFAANIGFCLGPVAEGYLVLLRADRRVARWLVFVPGLLLACALTLYWLSNWRLYVPN
jgi:hypothetical protein